MAVKLGRFCIEKLFPQKTQCRTNIDKEFIFYFIQPNITMHVSLYHGSYDNEKNQTTKADETTFGDVDHLTPNTVNRWLAHLPTIGGVVQVSLVSFCGCVDPNDSNCRVLLTSYHKIHSTNDLVTGGRPVAHPIPC